MDVAPYTAQQSNIDAAWEAAKNQIAQQRTQLGLQYGGSFDSGGHFSIDNTSQYGATQNLRNTQGNDLNSNAEQESERGIGTPGYGLAGQRESLMRYGQGQQQFDLLNQAQNSYMNTATAATDAQLQHDTATTSLGIQKAGELALENSWTPAPTPPVPGMPTSPIPGIGNSTSSYLSPLTVAQAAAKSKAPKVGTPFNSGVHAM